MLRHDHFFIHIGDTTADRTQNGHPVIRRAGRLSGNRRGRFDLQLTVAAKLGTEA